MLSEEKEYVFRDYISEEEANAYVKQELENLIGHEVLEMHRYTTDEKNFMTYHVYFYRRYKDSLKKVLLPFTSNHYHEFLRRALIAQGYEIKHLKRKYKEETDELSFCISYYNKREEEKGKTL